MLTRDERINKLYSELLQDMCDSNIAPKKTSRVTMDLYELTGLARDTNLFTPEEVHDAYLQEYGTELRYHEARNIAEQASEAVRKSNLANGLLEKYLSSAMADFHHDAKEADKDAA